MTNKNNLVMWLVWIFAVIIVFLFWTGIIHAATTDLAGKMFCCTDPGRNWIDKTKLCGYSEIDDLSFKHCEEKGGLSDYSYTGICKDEINFVNRSISCSDVNDSCFCTDRMNTWKCGDREIGVGNSIFTYSENKAPQEVIDKYVGKVIYENTTYYITPDESTYIIEPETTEVPTDSVPKISMEAQRIESLKSQIADIQLQIIKVLQLLIAKLGESR